MSTSLYREKGYRFFFFSEERQEPPHIHVEKAGKVAKIWLNPVEISKNYGFTNKELSFILSIVKKHQKEFLEKWNEYFKNKK
ncbi:DUF4160 domain-containing protein [Persephonella sp.]